MPEKASVWYLHAQVLEKLNRNEEAFASLERALKIDSEDINFWRLYGWIYNKIGRYDQAVLSFSHVLKHDENDKDTRLLRANAYYKQGEYVQALEDVEVVRKLDSSSISVMAERVKILISLRRYVDAITEYDNILRGIEEHNIPDARDTFVHLAKINMYLLVQKHDRIYECWQKVVAVGRETDVWHKMASDTLLFIALSGDLEFAYKLIIDSNMPETFFPLARALEHLLTYDKMLLETLSPEVRNIVEDIVQQIQQTQKWREEQNAQAQA